MKSFGAEFLRPDALPGVNHMRVIGYLYYYYRFIVRFPIGSDFLFIHHEEFWRRVFMTGCPSRRQPHAWVGYLYYYYRFIVHFPIGSDYLFIHHEEFWRRVFTTGCPSWRQPHACDRLFILLLSVYSPFSDRVGLSLHTL